MLIHQSDLQSMNRCGEQHRRQLAGERGKQLSATAYGSVMHHALHTLERTRDLQLALNTFEHYWHPTNIDAICEPVEEWIARDSYGALRTKGLELLKRYWDLKAYDDSDDVLALEISFVVPIPGTWDEELGRPHELAGTIDRLARRKYRGRQMLCIDDWKTGKKKSYLRHNVQHIAYAWATITREFWEGNPDHYTEGFGARGPEMFAWAEGMPRQGWWIDVSGTTPKWNDCGVKTPVDYLRFFRAVQMYTRARQHGIFQLAIEGEVCQYCSFRDDCPQTVTP
jgi:hypothetical protein